jgi:acylaminoacyl-peptidase
MKALPLVALGALLAASPGAARQSDTSNPPRFEMEDVFDLEFASSPEISPDGQQVVYVRNFMDIMADRGRSNLWIMGFDGQGHRALTTGNRNDGSPRWSPDGRSLLYVSSEDGSSQLYLRWMDTGQHAKLTNLTRAPGNLTWSPDGQWIAFTMFVPEQSGTFTEMPPRPSGAEWAPAAKVIDNLLYRSDGQGYLEDGYTHLFVVPVEGGTPRQLTSGSYNHGGTPSWAPDSRSLVISANRHEHYLEEPLNSEVYEITLSDGSIRALTTRNGPDNSPVVSPDGSRIAYLGFDDRYQGYQVSKLHVMNRDGRASRILAPDLDRDASSPVWSADGRGLYFQYDDEGDTKLAFVTLDGDIQELTTNVGGLSLGRPYGGGSFTVASNGRFAFTHTSPDHPADLAVGRRGGGQTQRLTHLNRDVFDHKQLGQVEEIWYGSSFDGRRIQGWIVKPPGFDPSRTYPLLLEIHGGPFANYGNRFSAEAQLYAAAGYVVLYTNPRGSTSYGEEFGNLIHHNYPSQDYDDLISGVDAVIALGYIDADALFVTGGSGGGVLTSWIVGKTDRFRAAVVAKPVINWYSFVLTADSYHFFSKYWFPGPPWEHQEHYMARSPISLVGNVTTPTMLLTGEADYRTPISESEQYYQALKLRGVETVMVRIPEASHGITARPSNLIKKVAHILEWFQRHQAPST